MFQWIYKMNSIVTYHLCKLGQIFQLLSYSFLSQYADNPLAQLTKSYGRMKSEGQKGSRIQMRRGKGMNMNSINKIRKEWQFFFKSNLLRFLVEYYICLFHDLTNQDIERFELRSLWKSKGFQKHDRKFHNYLKLFCSVVKRF